MDRRRDWPGRAQRAPNPRPACAQPPACAGGCGRPARRAGMPRRPAWTSPKRQRGARAARRRRVAWPRRCGHVWTAPAIGRCHTGQRRRVAWLRLGGHAGTLERSMSAQGRGHATGRIKTLGDGPPARRLTDRRSVPQAVLLDALRGRRVAWPRRRGHATGPLPHGRGSVHGDRRVRGARGRWHVRGLGRTCSAQASRHARTHAAMPPAGDGPCGTGQWPVRSKRGRTDAAMPPARSLTVAARINGRCGARSPRATRPPRRTSRSPR